MALIDCHERTWHSILIWRKTKVDNKTKSSCVCSTRLLQEWQIKLKVETPLDPTLVTWMVIVLVMHVLKLHAQVKLHKKFLLQLKYLLKTILMALQAATMRHEFGAEWKNYLLELALFSMLALQTCNKDDTITTAVSQIRLLR